MATCPKCNGTKHIKLESGKWGRCDCVTELKCERAMINSGFPLSLLKVKTEDFKLDSQNRKILGRAIIKQITDFDPTKPFYIQSATSEKEKAAVIITKQLIRKYSSISTALFVSLEDMADKYFNRTTQQTDSELSVNSVDILCISVGEEITNSAHAGMLYSTLYNRILNEKFTIIVSSINKGMLRTIYKDKVSQLLDQNALFFEC